MIKSNTAAAGLLLVLVIVASGRQLPDDDDNQEQNNHPLLPYDVIKYNWDAKEGPEIVLVLEDDQYNDDDYDDSTQIIGGGEDIDNARRCDQQHFRRCVQSYADDLDLEQIPIDSGDFIKQLTRIVQAEGLDGLKKECGAGANFKRCLGDDQFGACVSEKFLKSIGVREEDAKVFVTLSVQIKYQCTEAFDTIIDNWDCIQLVEREDRDIFKQCQQEYNRKMRTSPSNACRYTQELVTCMTTPFRRSCSPAVYGVLCHSMQISIATAVPQCSIICNAGADNFKLSSDGSSAETIASFLARIVLQNVPSSQLADAAFPRTPSSPSCQIRRFKLCVNKFVEHVGLPSLPKRAKALATYLNQMIATKKGAGVEQVCSAAQDIASCLGDQIESCFAVDYLESLGMSITDVLIYREMRAGLASECGPGYQVMHDNVDCMIQAASEQMAGFSVCATAFERSVKLDPVNACRHTQNYLNCNSGIFEQTCGRSVSAATCDAMRAEMLVVLANCRNNLTCIHDSDNFLDRRKSIAAASINTRNNPVFLASRLAYDVLTSTASSNNSALKEGILWNKQRESAQCNDRKFGQCLRNFAHQLGMKSFPSDPAEFSRVVQAIITKYGKIGFRKICTAGSRLTGCLGGPTQRDACINVDHLIQLGLTKEQAITYFVASQELNYECNEAYDVIYKNFDCIIDIQKSGISNGTFAECLDEFQTRVKRDPKRVCAYAQSLVECDVRPYYYGCSAEVGRTVCSIFQTVLRPVLPRCPVRCRPLFYDTDEEYLISAVAQVLKKRLLSSKAMKNRRPPIDFTD